METTLDCMPCFVRQALGAVRMVTDDVDTAGRMLREVLWEMSQMSTQQSPVVMAQHIHRLVRQLAGGFDPYRDIKDQCNLMALECLPRVEEMVRDSSEPLATALRISIAGNAIDLGTYQHVDKKHVEEAIAHALESPLSGDLADFADTAAQAQSILYLADNAGEIVFDRLLIEQLGPERVTVAVRGMAVLNDATLVDAETAGLTDLVEVIDNGSDSPGTLLDDCSVEFRRRFEQADMIIAKGQGNYESLNDADREVFLVLKVKCPVIAAQLDCPVSSLIVKRCGNNTIPTVNQIQQDLQKTVVDTESLPAEIQPV